MKSVFIGLFVICLIQGIYSDGTIAESLTNYRLPQYRETFIETIENIAKQAIQLAIDAVKIIQTRIEQIFQQVYDQIFGIQQNANNVLDTILSDFDKLYEIQNDVNSCVQAHVDEVKNVISKGREDISKCLTTTMDELNNIRHSLMPYVESIGNLIQNITGVVDKCSAGTNPISIAICITQHVTDVSNAISGIIHDAQEAIKLASVQIHALVLNTQGCVKTSLETVKNDVESVVAVIKDCIANNA